MCSGSSASSCAGRGLTSCSIKTRSRTKERYHQCTNINCSCTFVTMESVERFIVTQGTIIPAPPYPTVGGQRPLWL
ncbi:ogr/Delta-like zinc finger family protein [Klebsiella variicola]|uniref:ogr/Delta-like zinc finger family protein n=1 Tax=Klebsiella variicola TaxID=244366 RepID=UPI00396A5E40